MLKIHNEMIGLSRDADSLERRVFNQIFRTLLLSTRNRKLTMPDEMHEMIEQDIKEKEK